jgi:hypothetical protein
VPVTLRLRVPVSVALALAFLFPGAIFCLRSSSTKELLGSRKFTQLDVVFWIFNGLLNGSSPLGMYWSGEAGGSESDLPP